MRMARLKADGGELVIAPNIAWIHKQKNGDCYVNCIGDGPAWLLDMPLSEAIDELNAAMNYDRWKEIEGKVARDINKPQ